MENIGHKQQSEINLYSRYGNNSEVASAHALLYIGDMIRELAKVLKDVNKVEETNTGFYIKDLNV